MPSIAVLGAGVIGLSTAINIQNIIPGAEVTVIADKFGKETTSSGAGALLLLKEAYAPNLPKERVRKWTKSSWEYFSGLALSELSKSSGSMVISGYMLGNNPIKKPLMADYAFTYRELMPWEVKQLSQDQYTYGSLVTTLIVDMTIYLPWLMQKFKDNGGVTETRRLSRLDELNGKFDVVVNCTGLGSRYLFNDEAVYPARGQIVKVRAPWIKGFIYTDDNTYLLPNTQHVALGGTFEVNNYNLEPLASDSKDILERCQKVWPAIKGADILDEWVGLRPMRDPVRVEKEVIKTHTGNIKVVHNYGHGAVGVALSWGTAEDAAKLVQESLHPDHRL